jgi:hypothetical protein
MSVDSYLNEYENQDVDYIWSASVIIHENYKDIPSEKVVKELITDIKKLSDLLKYSDNKHKRTIAGILNDKKFTPSILRELRELFYFDE